MSQVYLLTDDLLFPPPEKATEDGLVAVGGDASPQRLVLAYSQGIFPWPAQGYPLLWFSPDPRYVLRPTEAHIGRSLRRALRRDDYVIRADTAFDRVIDACSTVRRPGQHGTWITSELVDGYRALHRAGYAHSVEAWADGELVGGLYGVSVGRGFFGESMFAHAADASKVAFATLLAQLARWRFPLVDCQVHTDHLERFGAVDWPRERFLEEVRELVALPSRVGPWELDVTPAQVVDVLGRAARSAG